MAVKIHYEIIVRFLKKIMGKNKKWLGNFKSDKKADKLHQ